VALTVAWFLLTFVFFHLVWVPPKKIEIYERPEVKAAYDRMARVLKRITVGVAGEVLVDGQPIEHADEYYSRYARIGAYVASHPGDLPGTYEVVWENGGLNRVYTSNTQEFEAVVSEFAITYYEATRPRSTAGEAR
jgi:hypothetical protein